MPKTFIATFAPGPNWAHGKTSREQAHWPEHAVFMDALFAEGVVVMGGPYADYSGVHLVVEADSENAVPELFKPDPFMINGILTLNSVKEWLVFLDVRRRN